MVNRDRLFRYQVTDPAQEEHTGKRDDKRRDLQRINQQPHERAKRAAHRQDQRKRQQRRDPPVADGFRQEYAGEGDHRPHGEIDPAGEDHKGHPHGDDPQEGVIGQNVADHARGGKAGKLSQAVEITQHENPEGDH